jgi:hypothetical protein
VDITPRDGAEAARRDYADTVRLWNSRFLPALDHWKQVGRLSEWQVDRLRALPINDQVREVLELEKEGIFFSKDLSKSVLYSIAAPGTSQHIAMLAFARCQTNAKGEERLLRQVANILRRAQSYYLKNHCVTLHESLHGLQHSDQNREL